MLAGFEQDRPLSSRTALGRWHGQPAFCKTAHSDLARARLVHEAHVLRALNGVHAPKLLAGDPEAGHLVVEAIDGGALALADSDLPIRVEALMAALATVHRAGWVHCDVKPAHVLITRNGTLRLVDWEHAHRIGQDLQGSPQRAWTPGLTHPDLIWGRGTASAELDRWSVDRITHQALALHSADSERNRLRQAVPAQ